MHRAEISGGTAAATVEMTEETYSQGIMGGFGKDGIGTQPDKKMPKTKKL